MKIKLLAIIAIALLLIVVLFSFFAKKRSDYFEPAHVEVGNGQSF